MGLVDWSSSGHSDSDNSSVRHWVRKNHVAIAANPLIHLSEPVVVMIQHLTAGESSNLVGDWFSQSFSLGCKRFVRHIAARKNILHCIYTYVSPYQIKALDHISHSSDSELVPCWLLQPGAGVFKRS